MKLKDIYIRDPYILPYHGMYYLYGKESQHDRKFVVYKSLDLLEWTEAKVVFAPNEDFWATHDYWAPEVHQFQGNFYMLASFKANEKCRGTQILKAEAPDGMFLPLTEYPQTPKDWECLDGTLYVDTDGIPYMIFCHEWTQIQNGTICYAKMNETLSEFVTEPKVMFRALDFPFVKNPLRNCECYVTDGPFLYRSVEGQLYMIWSSFGKKGYFINVLKSDTGEIDGTWTSQNMLFEDDGGHGMLFFDFSGGLNLIFHYPNNPKGEERAVIFPVREENGRLMIETKGENL